MSSLEPLQCTLIFFYCYVNHRDLHSFPTRRSSDLIVGSGSDSTLDEVTIDSGTAVTLNTGATLTLAGTIGGLGEIVIAGASKIIGTGTVLVPVNAVSLANNTTLTLAGSAAEAVVSV